MEFTDRLSISEVEKCRMGLYFDGLMLGKGQVLATSYATSNADEVMYWRETIAGFSRYERECLMGVWYISDGIGKKITQTGDESNQDTNTSANPNGLPTDLRQINGRADKAIQRSRNTKLRRANIATATGQNLIRKLDDGGTFINELKNKTLKALRTNNGIISKAIRQAGISRLEYNTMLEDELFKEAAQRIREDEVTDIIEDAYFTKLEEDPSDALIIHGLKTKGKSRGWSEKVDINVSGTIDIRKLIDEGTKMIDAEYMVIDNPALDTTPIS